MILGAKILLITYNGREETLDKRNFIPHGEKIGL